MKALELAGSQKVCWRNISISLIGERLFMTVISATLESLFSAWAKPISFLPQHLPL